MGDPVDFSVVGPRIRACRKELALSQARFGQLAGLSGRTVRRLEGGMRLKLPHINAIARVFGAPPETFWAEEFDAAGLAAAFIDSLVQQKLEA